MSQSNLLMWRTRMETAGRQRGRFDPSASERTSDSFIISLVCATWKLLLDSHV